MNDIDSMTMSAMFQLPLGKNHCCGSLRGGFWGYLDARTSTRSTIFIVAAMKPRGSADTFGGLGMNIVVPGKPWRGLVKTGHFQI